MQDSSSSVIKLTGSSEKGLEEKDAVRLPRASLSLEEDDEDAGEYYMGGSSEGEEEEDWADAEAERSSSNYSSDAGGWDDERAGPGPLIAKLATMLTGGGAREHTPVAADEHRVGKDSSLGQVEADEKREEEEKEDGPGHYPALSVSSEQDYDTAGDLDYGTANDEEEDENEPKARIASNPDPSLSLSSGMEEEDAEGREEADGEAEAADEEALEVVKEVVAEEPVIEQQDQGTGSEEVLNKGLSIRVPQTVQSIDVEEDTSGSVRTPTERYERISSSLPIRSSDTISGVRFEDEDEDDEVLEEQVTPGREQGVEVEEYDSEEEDEEVASPSPYTVGLKVRQQSGDSPLLKSQSDWPLYLPDQAIGQSAVQDDASREKDEGDQPPVGSPAGTSSQAEAAAPSMGENGSAASGNGAQVGVSGRWSQAQTEDEFLSDDECDRPPPGCFAVCNYVVLAMEKMGVKKQFEEER